MPSKTFTDVDLRRSGALLPVRVQPAGTMIPGVAGSPPESTVVALIDTGAARTCISPRVAGGLGLEPVDRTRVYTPGGEAVLPVYCVDLVPLIGAVEKERPHFAYLTVYGMRPHARGFDCLLGRDVLQAAHLSYDGRRERFTISF